MRVAFLLPKILLAGGIYIVLEHARRLASDHDFDVTVVLTEDAFVHHPFPSVDQLEFLSLAEAADHRFDIAVATWWETVFSLPSVNAERYVHFIQSLEDRFYDVHADWARARAGAPQMLPLTFVTAARWLGEQLRAFQPGARCYYVRSGIDKDTFRPQDPVPATPKVPLRIVVEGPADVWFKGVPETIEAISKMREKRHLTVVTGDGSLPAKLEAQADSVRTKLMHSEMADLFAESHVLVKLSRVEGMAGPPLEAFHKGATAVLAPVTGLDEYAVHGWNCQLVGYDDLGGTARTLDLLARDRPLLHVLRSNAAETARAWPDWRQSTTVLAGILRHIAKTPPPADPATTRQLILSTHASLMSLHTPRARPLTGEEEQLIRVGRRVSRAYRHPLVRPFRPLLRLAGRLVAPRDQPPASLRP